MIEGLNKETLEKLYIKEGKSVNEIAEMFSCHPQTVRWYCKKYSIETRGHKKIEGLSKSLLHKLYVKEGKTIREIGKILGCSRESARLKCKKMGIPLRWLGRKNGRIDIDKTTLRRLYIQEGMSTAEIAKILGCSLSRVYKKAKEIGL
jgi:DNA-binding CsgD family transcriptional regulator